MDQRMYPTGNDPRAGGVHKEVLGTADGFRIVSGEVTLDGGNPTTVATGLTAIVSAVACIKTATALGDDPVTVTTNWAALSGSLDIHAWKHDGSDPTLVASTDSAEVIAWIAVGT